MSFQGVQRDQGSGVASFSEENIIAVGVRLSQTKIITYCALLYF